MAETKEHREEDEAGEAYAEEPAEPEASRSPDGPIRVGAEGSTRTREAKEPPAAPHRATVGERIEQLHDLKEKARLGGGAEAVERQHARGKLTARERLEPLLDPK